MQMTYKKWQGEVNFAKIQLSWTNGLEYNHSPEQVDSQALKKPKNQIVRVAIVVTFENFKMRQSQSTL